MNRKRSVTRLACGILILSLVGGFSLLAQTPAQRATEKPFLWRIEGPVPSYLYGTVHVPDPRVLELPDVVRRALNASDVFNAEIPLDNATQLSMMGKIMLPAGQDLRSVVGADVYSRVVGVVRKILGNNAPPGAADTIAMMFQPMKPWAVMSQLELLEFLPDITAGRQPLDAMLFRIAEMAGKELGSLETVDEQIAVFEGFTKDEQVKMLVSSLDEIENAKPGSVSASQQLVQLYLDGDLNRLAAEVNKQYPKDEALNKKMVARVVDDRNTRMSEKIAALCARRPAKSYFFAVGALHYAGDTGIISQLSKKGLKVTRLGPNDAASIIRKPAA